MGEGKIIRILGESKLEKHETAVEYLLDIFKEERNRLIAIILNEKSADRDYFISRFIELENYIFYCFDEILEWLIVESIRNN